MQCIYMQIYINKPAANYEIYVGDTSQSGAYTTSNTLCYTGMDGGLAECIATGRYIVFKYLGTGEAEFGEVYAFAKKNVGAIAHGDTVTTTGLSVTDGDKNRLHGPSDSDVSCMNGDVSSKTWTATITFNRSVEVSDVAIFTRTSSSINNVQIDTMVDGVTTSCGSMSISDPLSNSIACASTLMAKEVTFTFSQ